MKMQLAKVGSGAPLVLVGGGLTGSLSWTPHAERLAATHEVLRAQPLAVQYGLEDRPLPDRYSIELESRALAEALADAVGTNAVDVVGWSYGAFIALDYALDHPERIRSLTLIEPPAIWVLSATNRMDDDSRTKSHSLRQLYESMTGDVTEEQLAQFCREAGFVPPGTTPQQMPQWPTWVEHRRSLRTGSATWDHVGSTQRLEDFPRPVLLVKGVGSTPLFHRIIDTLAQTLRRSEVIELPAGHAPHIVSMDVFLGALTRFLENARP